MHLPKLNVGTTRIYLKSPENSSSKTRDFNLAVKCVREKEKVNEKMGRALIQGGEKGDVGGRWWWDPAETMAIALELGSWPLNWNTTT